MKTLRDQIDAYEEIKKQNVPEEILTVMNQATEALKTSELETQCLKSGSMAPEFNLPNHKGETISLSELLKDGPLVLNFYRGAWCPYCSLELKALQDNLTQITESGAQLVAISPQTPDNSLSTREKNELVFDVLSDVGNQVAKAYGLVFRLPASLEPIYDKFGLDIRTHNGDDTLELPVPATYIIGQDGRILFDFVDADYTQRLEPSTIISILSSID